MGALRDPRHECYARELAAGSSMRLAWITAGFPEMSRNWARLARRRNVARRIEELRSEFK